MQPETIFAVSTGRPPAAIAVIRISGPHAIAAAVALAGTLPAPRRAGVRTLRAADGAALDHVLVLSFPAPLSATGEDVVELHCHGGRAVVDAVEAALAAQVGLRRAAAGEFTRRALINGRIDLAQAEGLGDLLAAETEMQRRAAMAAVEGVVGRAVHGWLDRMAGLAAEVEALLDFAEEDDVAGTGRAIGRIGDDLAILAGDIRAVLADAPIERLRDGIRVVLAGPPNSGKSTLLNRLADRDVAIVTPIAGTTRDRIDAAVARAGMPYLLTDTAGLTASDDAVERIGVARAIDAIDTADVLLWLGDDPPPRPAVWVHARADLPGRETMPSVKDVAVAAGDPGAIDALWRVIADRAAVLIPAADRLPLSRAQRACCLEAAGALAPIDDDPLLVAEALRVASRTLGRILGLDATDVMLDALFGKFCIGK